MASYFLIFLNYFLNARSLDYLEIIFVWYTIRIQFCLFFPCGKKVTPMSLLGVSPTDL